MNRTGIVKALIFFFCLSSSAHLSANEKITQIVTLGGPYHGEEVKVESSSGWFALLHSGNDFELRKISIEVTKVHDGVVDKDPTIKTGKSIAMTPSIEQSAVLLIKPGSDLALREGSIVGKKFETGRMIYRVPTTEKTSLIIMCQRAARCSSKVATPEVLRALSSDFLAAL